MDASKNSQAHHQKVKSAEKLNVHTGSSNNTIQPKRVSRNKLVIGGVQRGNLKNVKSSSFLKNKQG